MSLGISKFFRRVAELAGVVAEDPDDRMERLEKCMRRTPLGSALMDFAAEQGIKFNLVNVSLERGIAAGDYNRSTKTLNLHAGMANDVLIGTIAHELRHVWQDLQTGARLEPHPSPLAALAIAVFEEADAHAFQEKFVEDYARLTRDKGPLKALYYTHDVEPEPSLGDGARFDRWVRILLRQGLYSQMELAFSARVMTVVEQDAELGRAQKLLSVRDSMARAIHVARAIDGVWPYKPESGPVHYLSSRSDEALLKQVTDLSFAPEKEAAFRVLEARHVAAVEKRATASPGPLKPAP